MKQQDNAPRRQPHQSNRAHDGDARWTEFGDDGGNDAATAAAFAAASAAERLAAYTDAVLGGRHSDDAAGTPEDAARTPEARVVRALAARVETAGVGKDLSPARQRRLKAEIMAAWDDAQAPWWERVLSPLRARLGVLARTLSRQPAWGAAVALLLIAFGVLLLAPPGAEITPGTAVGPLSVGMWVGLGLLGVAAAGALWLVGRRRK